MKRIAILGALALAFPVLAQNSPTFRAALTGYDEVPSVNTLASGTFEARLDAAGTTADYTLTYSGLQAPVTMAHIHFATRGVNGSIVVWLCGTAASPGPSGTPTCPGTGGTVSGTITSAQVVAASNPAQQFPAADFAALVEAMRADAAYVNVHSNASPGGEIRGQVSASGQGGR